MISSAVIIPDEPEALSPTSNSTHDQSTSLKRRQSELSESPDSNKRPRIDTEAVTALTAQHGVPSPSSPNTAHNATSPVAPSASEGAAMSPPRRRPTAKLDEKSRNRRLFGALLGNLAQPASRTKPSTKTGTSTTSASTTSRREDIESRQRQRLQRESEEISQHARRKKEELNSKRRVEQRRWDDQGLRIKHANMRATAGFLRTKAEPRLYYKPWEMRGPEEEIIKRQKDDIEQTIKRDWEAWELEKRRQEDAEREKEKADAIAKSGSADGETEENDVQVTSGDTNGSTDDRKTSEHEPSQERPPSRSSNRAVSSVRSVSAESKGPGSDRPQSSKGDDHGGEELELGQGQEDDVIY